MPPPFLSRSPCRPAVRPAGGYSLIEVLVSILIVSMGILALVGLLTVAARNGKTSEIRAQAALMAGELADQIRTNADGAAIGAYDLRAPFPSPGAATPVPAVCVEAAPCTAGQLAAVDLAAWRRRLRALLPNGSAWVQYQGASATALGAVDLWVAWTDPLPGVERPGSECPGGLGVAADNHVRCVHLQVGLR